MFNDFQNLQAQRNERRNGVSDELGARQRKIESVFLKIQKEKGKGKEGRKRKKKRKKHKASKSWKEKPTRR